MIDNTKRLRTPDGVARLMVALLEPDEGMSVYDPVCGSAELLLEAAQYVKRAGKDPRKLSLYGEEENPIAASDAKIKLAPHGFKRWSIRAGDALTDPQFVTREDQHTLFRFDRVLANPHFSRRSWGRDKWVCDPFGRHRGFTCPPGKRDAGCCELLTRGLGTSRCHETPWGPKPSHWSHVALDEILAENGLRGGVRAPKEGEKDTVAARFVRQGAFGEDRAIDLELAESVVLPDVDYRLAALQRGDVLMKRVHASRKECGKSAILRAYPARSAEPVCSVRFCRRKRAPRWRATGPESLPG